MIEFLLVLVLVGVLGALPIMLPTFAEKALGPNKTIVVRFIWLLLALVSSAVLIFMLAMLGRDYWSR